MCCASLHMNFVYTAVLCFGNMDYKILLKKLNVFIFAAELCNNKGTIQSVHTFRNSSCMVSVMAWHVSITISLIVVRPMRYKYCRLVKVSPVAALSHRDC